MKSIFFTCFWLRLNRSRFPLLSPEMYRTALLGFTTSAPVLSPIWTRGIRDAKDHADIIIYAFVDKYIQQIFLIFKSNLIILYTAKNVRR